MTTKTRTVTAIEAGRIELVESPRAELRPDQVAGPTLVTLLSPGTELSLAYSTEPTRPFPIPLGYAAVFRVERVGSGVKNVTAGDVVISMGPHASWQCVEARHVIAVPVDLAPAIAVFSRIMNVPMTAIATSRCRFGQQAAVIGLGLIGQMTARTLAAAGFETSAADASEQRRGMLRGVVPSAPELEEGSVDMLVECSGREENILAGAKALRSGGELILTGVPWRRRADTYLFDIADIVFHRFITIRSGWEWQVPIRATGMAGGIDMIRLFTRSLQLLRSGGVAVDGLSEYVAPEKVAAAYEAIRTRTATTLSYVIRW